MSFKVLSSPSGNIWMAQSSLPRHHSLTMGSSLVLLQTLLVLPKLHKHRSFSHSPRPRDELKPLLAIHILQERTFGCGIKKNLGEFLFLGRRAAGMSWIPPQPRGRNANPAGLVRGPRASNRLESWEKKGKKVIYTLVISSVNTWGTPRVNNFHVGKENQNQNGLFWIQEHL